MRLRRHGWSDFLVMGETEDELLRCEVQKDGDAWIGVAPPE